jgi:predicted ribosomally synthesized peptide with nif11-like leader
MSLEQLKAFLGKVKADSSIQEKLKSAADANAIAAISKEAGFSISGDDLKKAQSEIPEEELEGRFEGLIWKFTLVRPIPLVMSLLGMRTSRRVPWPPTTAETQPCHTCCAARRRRFHSSLRATA